MFAVLSQSAHTPPLLCAMEGFLDAPTAAAPVLPKGHPPLPKPPPLRTFTLESLLAETQSSSNPKRLVAVKGAIFDVSADSRFQAGGKWHEAVGRDLTRTLAFTTIATPAAAVTDATSEAVAEAASAAAPPSSEPTPAAASSAASSAPVVSSAPLAPLHLESEHQGARALEGLDFDALRTLETWSTFFQDQFEVVGRIRTDYEEEAATGGAKWSRPGEAEMAPLPSDIYGCFLPLVENSSSSGSGANASSSESSLHSLMDADQQDQAGQLIDSLPVGSPLLDRPCPRSAMTPLHKAVERDWLDVVQSLLAKGADARLPCSLYDGETALDMARRFQSNEIVAALEAHRA